MKCSLANSEYLDASDIPSAIYLESFNEDNLVLSLDQA